MSNRRRRIGLRGLTACVAALPIAVASAAVHADWERVLGTPRTHDVVLGVATPPEAGTVRVLVEHRGPIGAGPSDPTLQVWSVDASTGGLVANVELPPPLPGSGLPRTRSALGAAGDVLSIASTDDATTRFLLLARDGGVRSAVGPALDRLSAWAPVGAALAVVAGTFQDVPRAALVSFEDTAAVGIPVADPVVAVVAAGQDETWIVTERRATGDEPPRVRVARVGADGAVAAEATFAGKSAALAIAKRDAVLVVQETEGGTTALVARGLARDLAVRWRRELVAFPTDVPTTAAQICTLPREALLVAAVVDRALVARRIDAGGRVTTVEPGLDFAGPRFALACGHDGGLVFSTAIAQSAEGGQLLNFQKVRLRRFAVAGGSR